MSNGEQRGIPATPAVRLPAVSPAETSRVLPIGGATGRPPCLQEIAFPPHAVLPAVKIHHFAH